MRKCLKYWNLSILANPFYVFSIVLAITFLLFSLQLSDLFPKPTPSFTFFFVLMLVTFTLIGWFWHKKVRSIALNESSDSLYFNLPLFFLITGILWSFYFIEFFINGFVPIVRILLAERQFDYRAFRLIPILHTLFYSFNVFFILYLYLLVQKTPSLLKVLLIFLNIVPFILFFSRGAFAFFVLPCIFLTLYFIKTLEIKHVGLLIIGFLTIVFLFGIAGNYRENSKENFNPTKIKDASKIKERYYSAVPEELTWFYMYAASPIANFQKTVKEYTLTEKDYNGLLLYNIIPRTFPYKISFNISRRTPVRISKSFTVGTAFMGPYIYAGWTGVFIVSFILIGLFSFTIYVASKESPFQKIVLAFICSFAVYNFFDNMIVYTPLLLMITWSMLFHILHIVKRKSSLIE